VVRIAIADDHTIVRRGMQLILARRPDWTIAVEASTPDELFEGVRHERLDAIVCDLTLRGQDILAQLHREHPAVPVLILSSAPEGEFAVPAIRNGARGYIGKDSSADEILDAIARVAAGRTALTPAVADLMAAEIMHPHEKAAHELLSAREREVFLLIARGISMTEIATTLGVSVKTASTYRTRIMEKTGFHTNADIVVYALKAKMI
jgi:DNA-binding NarL/FixJ family response regulator